MYHRTHTHTKKDILVSSSTTNRTTRTACIFVLHQDRLKGACFAKVPGKTSAKPCLNIAIAVARAQCQFRCAFLCFCHGAWTGCYFFDDAGNGSRDGGHWTLHVVRTAVQGDTTHFVIPIVCGCAAFDRNHVSHHDCRW